MDLSKAFDSIPHDLLIAKMHTYSLSINAVTFFYSYLKRCTFKNIFINDLYLWISKTDLLNFANAAESTIEKLISALEQDSQAATDWFKTGA